MFSQCKIWVNIDQKVLAEYIEIVAHHIREILKGTTDQICKLIFEESMSNKIYQYATELICSAIVKV